MSTCVKAGAICHPGAQPKELMRRGSVWGALKREILRFWLRMTSRACLGAQTRPVLPVGEGHDQAC